MRVFAGHKFLYLRIALILLATVIGYWFPLTYAGTRVELNYWDHFVTTNPLPISPELVVIEASEKSMNALGPTAADRRIVPRDIMARIIRTIDRFQPKVLAMDIWFDPGLNKSLPKQTAELVSALASCKTPIIASVKEVVDTNYDLLGFELPFFVEEVPKVHLSHTSIVADIDESVRSPEAFLWDEERQVDYAQMALVTYAVAKGYSSPTLDEDRGLAKVGEEEIALGDFGTLPLRYAELDSIRPIEIHDFLRMADDTKQRSVLASKIKDKIVILSGLRQTDLHSTPMGRQSGSAIVASSVNTLIDGTASKSLRHSVPANVAWICMLAILAVTVTAAARNLWVVAGVLAVCCLTWLMPQWTYPLGRIEFGAPALAVTISLLGGFSIEITRSRLLPLARPPQEATVLFVDVRGSTSLVTDKGIKIVGELMGKVFRVLSKAIRETGGEVERTTGDGVMVVFRRNGERSTAESCLASIEPIQREIKKINEWFEAQHGSTVEVRMGVESGEIATMIIEGRGMEPSSVGGAVNMAARLLALAQEEGFHVLIGPRTEQMASDQFDVQFVGERELKGFEGTVSVYEYLGVKGKPAVSAKGPARR